MVEQPHRKAEVPVQPPCLHSLCKAAVGKLTRKPRVSLESHMPYDEITMLSFATSLFTPKSYISCNFNERIFTTSFDYLPEVDFISRIVKDDISFIS